MLQRLCRKLLKNEKLDDKSNFVFDYSSAFDYSSIHTILDPKGRKKTIFKYHNKDHLVDISECESEPWQSAVIRSVAVVLCYFVLLFTFPVTLWFCVKRISSLERIAIFRLGKLMPVQGPGLVVVFPGVDRYQKVDLKPKRIDVPQKEVLLGDGAVVDISASLMCQVVHSAHYVTRVKHMDSTVSALCQQSMSTVLSYAEHSDLERHMDSLQATLLTKMNDTVLPWGLEVVSVEIKLEKVVKEPEPMDAISPLIKVFKSALGLITNDPPKETEDPVTGATTSEPVPISLSNGKKIKLHKFKKGKAVPGVLHAVPAVPADPQFEALISVLDQVARQASGHSNFIKCRTFYKLVIKGSTKTDGVCVVYMLLDHGDSRIFRDGEMPPSTSSDDRDPMVHDAAMTLLADDLTLMLLGVQSPIAAYMSGRIGVEGDWGAVKRLLAVMQGAR